MLNLLNFKIMTTTWTGQKMLAAFLFGLSLLFMCITLIL